MDMDRSANSGDMVMKKALSVCVWVLLGLTLAGCQYDNGPSATEMAQAAFTQGDYAKALSAASRAASHTGGRDGDLANYLAGISAYKLGNLSTAERYLRVATGSHDESMAADAYSTLGLIYSRDGRYAEAANAFLHGANLQSGEDRAQAYFYGGIAQQKLGRWPQARTSLLLARKTTRDAGLSSQIDQQLAVTGYTIQLGAFANRTNADKLAGKYALRAAQAKLGGVFVTPGSGSSGRTMHLVQVGRFATFSAASAGRSRLGVSDAVVVPLQR